MTSHAYMLLDDEEVRKSMETTENATLRPVLDGFARHMEMKLRRNDHKTSWRELPVEALFKMLMLEIEEFKLAHEFLGDDEARKELVDVANFCLILHDRLGMGR